MNIAIVGATGQAGRLIMQEALARGHQVTAIVRNAQKLDSPELQHAANKLHGVIEKNVFDINAADLATFDVVVNAFNATFGTEHEHVTAGQVLANALTGSAARLAVVGSGGSLFTDASRTQRVHESTGFPVLFLDTALQMHQHLKALEASIELNWVYLSPSGLFDAQGKRSGVYHTGSDVALLNAQGECYTSYADFAMALLDEIEVPTHINQRYAVVSGA